jgi:glycosyltransferase involved in cell wall biosynthesis
MQRFVNKNYGFSMKISGCTFVRNGFLLGYPVKESLQSLLSICDEVVIAVGNSEDDTLKYVQSLNDPKIKIIETIWDDSMREDGRILAQQTNIALEQCSGDWIIYLQADEVLHEQEIELLKTSMMKAETRPEIEGLLFKYLHFFGDYAHIGMGRQWYRREIRAFRNTGSITSWKDAQGFRVRESDSVFRKLRVLDIPVHIYHYGWVRNPSAYLRKQAAFGRLYHDDAWLKEHLPTSEEFPICYELAEFTGTHPEIMHKRIKEDGLWTKHFDPNRRLSKPFAVAVCDTFERLTGKRVFEYRNYEILR